MTDGGGLHSSRWPGIIKLCTSGLAPVGDKFRHKGMTRASMRGTGKPGKRLCGANLRLLQGLCRHV